MDKAAEIREYRKRWRTENKDKVYKNRISSAKNLLIREGYTIADPSRSDGSSILIDARSLACALHLYANQCSKRDDSTLLHQAADVLDALYKTKKGGVK